MKPKNWSSVVISLALAGFVILPVFAYIGGHLIAGPYDGEYGVIGYLISIYRAVPGGERAAIVLVTAPALVVGAWYAALGLRAYLSRLAEPRPAKAGRRTAR